MEPGHAQSDEHEHCPLCSATVLACYRLDVPNHAGNDEGMYESELRTPDVAESIQTLRNFIHSYKNSYCKTCWGMIEQASRAANDLILVSWSTENGQSMGLVDQAYAVFLELDQLDTHKPTKTAVGHIAGGLAAIGHRKQERQTAASPKPGAPQTSRPVLRMDSMSLPDLSRYSPSSDDIVLSRGGVLGTPNPHINDIHQEVGHPGKLDELSDGKLQHPMS